VTPLQKKWASEPIEKRIHELDEAVAETYGWLYANPYHTAAPLMREMVLEWDIDLQNLKAEAGIHDY
jgi:hypothetical protein